MNRHEQIRKEQVESCQLLEVEYGLPIAKLYCAFPAILLEAPVDQIANEIETSATFDEVRIEYLFVVSKLVWQDKDLCKFFDFARNNKWVDVVEDFCSYLINE